MDVFEDEITDDENDGEETKPGKEAKGEVNREALIRDDRVV